MSKNYSQRSYVFYGDKQNCTKLLRQIKITADSFPSQSVWVTVTRDSFLSDLFRNLQDASIKLTSQSIQVDFVSEIDPMYLVDTFEKIGFQAKQFGKIICLFVEDMHLLNKIEAESLCMAIHKSNQMRLPIILFGTGMPTVIHLLADARPYAERLFIYHEIL